MHNHISVSSLHDTHYVDPGSIFACLKCIFLLYLKIATTVLKIIYTPYSKLSNELKNNINI